MFLTKLLFATKEKEDSPQKKEEEVDDNQHLTVITEPHLHDELPTEVEAESQPESYSSLKKDELISVAKKAGLDVDRRQTKAQIIDLLTSSRSTRSTKASKAVSAKESSADSAIASTPSAAKSTRSKSAAPASIASVSPKRTRRSAIQSVSTPSTNATRSSKRKLAAHELRSPKELAISHEKAHDSEYEYYMDLKPKVPHELRSPQEVASSHVKAKDPHYEYYTEKDSESFPKSAAKSRRSAVKTNTRSNRKSKKDSNADEDSDNTEVPEESSSKGKSNTKSQRSQKSTPASNHPTKQSGINRRLLQNDEEQEVERSTRTSKPESARKRMKLSKVKSKRSVQEDDDEENLPEDTVQEEDEHEEEPNQIPEKKIFSNVKVPQSVDDEASMQTEEQDDDYPEVSQSAVSTLEPVEEAVDEENDKDQVMEESNEDEDEEDDRENDNDEDQEGGSVAMEEDLEDNENEDENASQLSAADEFFSPAGYMRRFEEATEADESDNVVMDLVSDEEEPEKVVVSATVPAIESSAPASGSAEPAPAVPDTLPVNPPGTVHFALDAFNKLGSKLITAAVTMSETPSTSAAEEPKLSAQEYDLLKSILDKMKPAEAKADEVTNGTSSKKRNLDVSTDRDDQDAQNNSNRDSHNDVDDGASALKKRKTGYDDSNNWNPRHSYVPEDPFSPSYETGYPTPRTSGSSGVFSRGSGGLFGRVQTPFNRTYRASISSIDSAPHSTSKSTFDSRLEEAAASMNKPAVVATPFDTKPYVGATFSLGSSSKLSVPPQSGNRTSMMSYSSGNGLSIMRNNSYTPQYRSNAASFGSTTMSSKDGSLLLTNAEESSLSYLEKRRLMRQSQPTASASVAKQILDTLGSLSSPMSAQQQQVGSKAGLQAKELNVLRSKGSSSSATAATTTTIPDFRAELATPLVSALKPSTSNPVLLTSAISSSAQPPVEKKDTEEKERRVKFSSPSTVETLSTPFVSQTQRAVESTKPAANATNIAMNIDDDTEIVVERRSSLSGASPFRPSSLSSSGGVRFADATSVIPSNNGGQVDEFTFDEPLVVKGVDTEEVLHLGRTDDIRYAFTPPSHKRRRPKELTTPAASKVQKQLMPDSDEKATKTPSKSESQSTAKPPATPAPAASLLENKPSIWSMAGNADKKKCQACMVMNAKTAAKCVSCETAFEDAPKTNSGSSAPSNPVAAAATSSANSFGATPAQPAKPNSFVFGVNPSASAAPASTAPAPAAAAVPFIFGINPASSEAAKPAEKESKDSEDKAAPKPAGAFTGFTFGAAPAASSATTAPVAEPPKTSGGFTFGVAAKPTEDKEEKPTPASATTAPITFGFGAPVSSKKEKESVEVAEEEGPSRKQKRRAEDDEETTSTKKLDAAPTFSLPAPASSSGFTFGASTASTSALPTFGAPSASTAAAVTPAAPASSTGFSFGASSFAAPAVEKKDAVTEKKETSTDSASKLPTFGGFSAAPASTGASAPAPFIFGAQAAAPTAPKAEEAKKQETPAAPLPLFGSTSTAVPVAPTLAPAPAISAFGSGAAPFNAFATTPAAAPSSSSTAAPLPLFGASSTTTVPAPSTTTTSTSGPFGSFGASSATPSTAPTAAAPLMFGSSSSSSSSSLKPASTTATFGATAPVSLASDSMDTGSNIAPPTSTAAPASGFFGASSGSTGIFGSAPAAPTTSSAPPAATSGSIFGSGPFSASTPAAPAAPASNPFSSSFGSAPAAAAPSSNPFAASAFGAAAPASSTPAGGLFGAPATATPAAAPAPFIFGSSAPAAAAPPAAGGGIFGGFPGAGAPAAPSSSSNMFGQPVFGQAPPQAGFPSSNHPSQQNFMLMPPAPALTPTNSFSAPSQPQSQPFASSFQASSSVGGFSMGVGGVQGGMGGGAGGVGQPRKILKIKKKVP